MSLCSLNTFCLVRYIPKSSPSYTLWTSMQQLGNHWKKKTASTIENKSSYINQPQYQRYRPPQLPVSEIVQSGSSSIIDGHTMAPISLISAFHAKKSTSAPSSIGSTTPLWVNLLFSLLLLCASSKLSYPVKYRHTLSTASQRDGDVNLFKPRSMADRIEWEWCALWVWW